MIAIGCEVYVHIPKQKRYSKLSERAKKELLVGYALNGRGYRVWMPKKQQIQESRDCVFIEMTTERGSNAREQLKDITDIQHGELTIEDDIDDTIINSSHEGQDSDTEKEIQSEANPNESVQDEEAVPEEEAQKKKRGKPKKDPTRVQPEKVRKHEMILRSTGSNFIDAPQLNVMKNSEEDPSCYQEVITSTESTQWLEAMTEELNLLKGHGSWELVKPPPDVTPIKCKWVYKRKTTNNAQRYKARLVAKGFTQRKGIDYEEIYAPVSGFDTIRLLIAVSVEKNWYIDQYDVKSAYLHSDLKEVIYMEQPEGFEETGQEGLVCKLKKSIYGLKQSGRCWNDHLDNTLTNIGFIRNKVDPCVYEINTEHGRAILTVYVDNMLTMAETEETRMKVRMLLKSCFEIKHVGEISQMLGVKIEKERDNRITLSQEKYIDQLVDKFGLEEAKGISTPMETKPTYLEEDDAEDNANFPYRELIGGLLYLLQRTRPDIAFAVAKLAQFCLCFNRHHWNAAKRVLRYVKETRNYQITYQTTGKPLVAFSDADWATCKKDRELC